MSKVIVDTGREIRILECGCHAVPDNVVELLTAMLFDECRCPKGEPPKSKDDMRPEPGSMPDLVQDIQDLREDYLREVEDLRRDYLDNLKEVRDHYEPLISSKLEKIKTFLA